MKNNDDIWDAYRHKKLDEYMDREQECARIDLKIDHQIEKYQALQLIKTDIRTIKDIRRPVSRRFGLIKGQILKECHSEKYDKGVQRCRELSTELKYVYKHLDEVHSQKAIVESGLEKIVGITNALNSYRVPLSKDQVLQLSNAVYAADLLIDNELIYFRPIKEKFRISVDSNNKQIQSLLNDQKSYINNIISELFTILSSPLNDFNDIDQTLEKINLKKGMLEEFLPQSEAIRLNKITVKEVINSSDILQTKLSRSKQIYDTLQENLQSLEDFSTEMKKYGISEHRLNRLGVIASESRKIATIPYVNLENKYISEKEKYANQIEIVIDNVIDNIDAQASKTPLGSSGSLDVLKYYEKVQTFRDISQKVKDYRNQLINTQTIKQKGPKPIYEIMSSESKPADKIPINPNSIVSMLKTVELPKDTRYWGINDILMGKRNEDGWIRSLELLYKELGELRSVEDLPRTDYVLKVATIVDDSYRNGQLRRLASIDKENKDIIESTLNELKDFGKIVSS